MATIKQDALRLQDTQLAGELGDAALILRLMAEQVERLLSLIDTPKGGYEKLLGIIPWLIYSDTSSDMTSNLTVMEAAKKIQPILIGPPNGSITISSKQGSVTLGKNVKLNKDLNCTVTFLIIFPFCKTALSGL